jgi:flagellar motor switch protein FliN/FliY
VTENPRNPNPAGQSPGDSTEAEIDALMGEVAGEASAATDADAQAIPEFTDEVAAQAEPVTQADIEALMGGAADADDEEPLNSADESDGENESAVTPQSSASGEESPEASHARAEQGGEEERVDSRPVAAGVDAQPLQLSSVVEEALASGDAKRVTMLNDVNLRVRIQLGQTRMLVEDVLRLGKGSVVELNKLAGDPVDVLVNDRLIARGEVLVLNDSFCVRVSEVLAHDPHRVSV